MLDKLTDYIIRPTRRRYTPSADLGPSSFTIDYIYYGSRTDFEIKNRRGKTLKCSLFHHNIRHDERYPLMVYCHGNSGNRTYSYEIVYKMLRQRISVLTFDFAGCGNSDGKYVFLGLFEQYDIEDVLTHALENYSFIDPKKIGIWGRSMGAVATLLFASRNHYISLIVLDSPFKDLVQLLKEYINRFKIVSGLFGNYIFTKMKKRALEKASFDFDELKPLESISTCRVPAFFIHATKDKIVPIHHSKELFEAYPGDKEYLEIKGGHNSKRPNEAYLAINEFIKDIFERAKRVPQGDRESIKQKKDKDYYYDDQQKDYKQDDTTSSSDNPMMDEAQKKQQKDYSGCEDSVKERVDMKELNDHYLTMKEPDDMGVSMITLNEDDSSFR